MPDPPPRARTPRLEPARVAYPAEPRRPRHHGAAWAGEPARQPALRGCGAARPGGAGRDARRSPQPAARLPLGEPVRRRSGDRHGDELVHRGGVPGSERRRLALRGAERAARRAGGPQRRNGEGAGDRGRTGRPGPDRSLVGLQLSAAGLVPDSPPRAGTARPEPARVAHPAQPGGSGHHGRTRPGEPARQSPLRHRRTARSTGADGPGQSAERGHRGERFQSVRRSTCRGNRTARPDGLADHLGDRAAVRRPKRPALRRHRTA